LSVCTRHGKTGREPLNGDRGRIYPRRPTEQDNIKQNNNLELIPEIEKGDPGRLRDQTTHSRNDERC
jgi:hypothetical protein